MNILIQYKLYQSYISHFFPLFFLHSNFKLPKLSTGPIAYRKLGNMVSEMINDDIIVVKSIIPNLFKTLDEHIMRNIPEKHDVRAPPNTV